MDAIFIRKHHNSVSINVSYQLYIQIYISILGNNIRTLGNNFFYNYTVYFIYLNVQ